MVNKAVQYYDANADDYDGCHAKMAPVIHKHYRQAIGDETIPNGRLLDVGIGTGLSSYRYSGTHTIYGVDAAPNMLTRCVKMARAAEKNLHCVDLDENDLPFNGNSFAFTISHGSLLYLNDACRIIKDMVRVTQPGGIIVFDVPFHEEQTTDTLSYFTRFVGQQVFIPPKSAVTRSFERTDIIAFNTASDPDEFEDADFGTAHYKTALVVLKKRSHGYEI